MSTVKTNAAQIGQSLTATNNFTMYQPSSPDGTVRWGVGNSGSVTDIITLNSSGNVGIGTSSPSYKLDVQPSANGTSIRAGNGGYLSSFNGDLYASGSASLASNGVWTAQNSGASVVAPQASGNILFYTNTGLTSGNTFSPTERMRIDSSGNVGIGNSSPGARLDVTADSTSYIKLRGRTSDNAVSLQFVNNTNSVQQGYIYVDGGPVMLFGVGNSERMRINSSGNVGIGLTNPSTKLDVSGDVQAVHGSGAFAYRVRADPTNTIGAIQWTNNGQSVDWGYISCPERGVMNFRTPDAATTSNIANFVFGGGSICVNKQTSSGGDVGDWPQPSIGVRGYDSNFNYVTMQTWGLRDDNVMYQTSNAVWNFRLGTGSSGATTSGSNTELSINGPGFLTCTAGSGGVILNNGATSWASLSDETLKDIIEPITGAAEKVASLRAVIGKYKTDADGKRRPFLIAQDVQAVLPEAVGTMQVPTAEVDPEDIYKPIANEEKLLLSYTDTIPLLVAAIKELKAELDATKAEVATLRKGA